MQNCKKTSQILRLTIVIIIVIVIIIIIIIVIIIIITIIIIIITIIIIIIIIITDSFPFHRAHRRSSPSVEMSRNALCTSLSRFLRRFHKNQVTTQITAATKMHDVATTVVWDAEFSVFRFMEVGVGVAVGK